MMKTPDEIKKGLEHCINGTSCRGCPYCEECAIASDCNPMQKDLQEYTKELECDLMAWGDVADSPGAVEDMARENAELLEKVEQLQAERDAAVKDIYEMAKCIPEDVCEWCDQTECERLCMMHLSERPGFKWRGVQKED